eukprot:15163283-Alexandrium_andersonii.AAC.1
MSKTNSGRFCPARNCLKHVQTVSNSVCTFKQFRAVLDLSNHFKHVQTVSRSFGRSPEVPATV